jgi:hypothetical protein
MFTCPVLTQSLFGPKCPHCGNLVGLDYREFDKPEGVAMELLNELVLLAGAMGIITLLAI